MTRYYPVSFLGALAFSCFTPICLARISYADKRPTVPSHSTCLRSQPQNRAASIENSYKHMTDAVLVNLMICRNDLPASVEILRRGRHSVPSLLSKLADPNLSDGNKVLLLTYLGSTREPRYVGAAGRYLIDGTPLVRAASAVALGNVNSRRSAHYLLRAIGDESEQVRYVLPTEVAGLRHYVSRHYLRQKLLWGSARERTGAAMCLGRLHDRESVNLLIKAIRDPNKDVQCASITALSEINTATARRVVIRIANSADGDLRDVAVFCANNFGRL